MRFRIFGMRCIAKGLLLSRLAAFSSATLGASQNLADFVLGRIFLLKVVILHNAFKCSLGN
jgi:predicted HAD superfamily hydrolase